MTVKELIERLQGIVERYPRAADVPVSCYECDVEYEGEGQDDNINSVSLGINEVIVGLKKREVTRYRLICKNTL